MPTATKSKIESITTLLSHLVKFPTVTSDQATNRVALDWIEQQLEGLPLHIRRVERAGFPSLVATTTETKNPKLWLCGHIDVVPGAPSQFKPTIKNGRLYGRGTHDMKFAIATFIALLRDLGADLADYDLGLMITSDEEVGGYNGVQWLVNDLGYRGGAVLTPDSNGSWVMDTGSKGIMWWELIASGKSSHASRPWEGVNAIDEITQVVALVREQLPKEPCGDPGHDHPTVNFGTITGGTAANQVADSATARLDVRFPPKYSVADATAWVQNAVAKVPNVHAKILISDPAYEVTYDGPNSTFRGIIQEVTGHDVTLATAHGSGDARHFEAIGISTINVCPTGSGYHVPDEWIDLADLALFHEVVKRFTAQWAGPSV